jgi:hypothetical protein
MLTNQGWEGVEGDIGEGVHQHDQYAGPEHPVTGRGILKKDFWVVEAQASDSEERVLLGNWCHNSLASGDKRGSN